jgi:beta-lactam-binding protein with PASTA domain/tRNA A-37 threonylcarbamoyl transferase component Bud32
VSGTTYTPTVSSTGDALIGRTLDGRYRVLRRLADGGMATVYLAIDERLDREVALKVMRPHLVHDETFVDRFRREARSSASLSHPNVVAVFDQGEDDGNVFLAMEYVPGQTLRDVLRTEGALSPRAALDVLEPVLLALAEAHATGLIHRDVKPENVILNTNGTVKVADFGLARAVSSHTVTSSSGLLLGTVAYLSPEQVETGVADARSDVYAAGLMLFEMLTGTKAFTGETAIHVAYQHVHGGVPVPSSRVPELPPALDDLVAVATARNPDERPADAGAFLALVRRARATLSLGDLDARPEGRAAVVAAAVPTSTAALPLQQGGAPGGSGAGAASGVVTRPRSDTAAMSIPPPPLQGVVVAGPPRRGRRWWPAILASALVAALTAWFFVLGPGATATVPSVVGRTEAQAVEAVRAASLQASVSRSFDEKVPAGQVISVDPAAGDTVQRGSQVAVVVSKGPERYAVPPVVGMTLAEARARITEVNLKVGKVTEAYNEEVPEGQVVSAKPGPGASLKKGTAVAMTVSKGRKPIDVPDLTGKDAKNATRTLKDLGLKVDATAAENSDTVPKGRVVRQEPRDGTLFRGDTVRLVVSKGPVLVDVPNVVGQQLDDARRTLEGAGFTVEVRRALGGFFGTVRLQDPAGGKAPKGSTVTVTIV